jgi:transketolase
MNEADLLELEKKAWQVRLLLVRMFGQGKAHHFGGSLSCAELLTALYFHAMRYTAETMHDPSRDRFIMSKGHSVPAQYAILSMLGVIPEAELRTIKQIGTRLQGHPDLLKTPGIEAPTGSLGQGLAFGNGIALAGRMDKLNFKVYVLLGDGELQEGEVWEAAMASAHYKLNNLCALIDRNRFQSQGTVEDLMKVEPLEEKWKSFGWNVRRVDGHNLREVCEALDVLKKADSDKPLVIIADTVKGKGVSFMENTYKYHNASLSEEQFHQAETEVLNKFRQLEG